ncbi:GntR family transcriptional regulator [Limimaricola cinnabarinus]|jgi:DNA-binding GntR family transcriptional regulator|uniref:Transcriptional regulator, GntR family n=1 Tax=Limimaricola cinnabarinus LL-001 TaxID=1337093 RepID=U2YPC9_9RHOB|nr:GntR family transcriptional regulator [Limimaricola cinnabarinus]GAD57246.1 transcriptional regulator, GntR family [Limimaricola cinnabarinus LL-001]
MTDATLPEQIALKLRRDILRGTLAPGDPIKERDNALDLGVSRTPLREAVRILAKEGLVLLRPSRSPVVADPSLKEVRDAVVVLQALETLSGELACREASDAEIAEIRALFERHHALSETAEGDALIELFEVDMAFHTAIARASHNPALAETHAAYLARMWRQRYLSAVQRRARERVRSQHENIVLGLEARDPARVGAEINAHLAALINNLTRLFEAREAGRDTTSNERDIE